MKLYLQTIICFLICSTAFATDICHLTPELQVRLLAYAGHDITDCKNFEENSSFIKFSGKDGLNFSNLGISKISEHDAVFLADLAKRYAAKVWNMDKTILNFSGNRLTEIPTALTDIELGSKWIRLNLNFSNNEISKLPNWNPALKTERFINLNDNKIKQIPTQFFQGFNGSIDLSNNPLAYRGEDFAGGKFGGLILQNTSVENAPNNVFNGIEYVWSLHLEDNCLTDSVFGKIVQIKSAGGIYLWNNSIELKSLPQNLSLGHLSDIDLSNNLIAQLPASSQWVEGLRGLSLRNNQLVDIMPNYFDKFFAQKGTQTLNIENNPIPQETLERLLKEYYRHDELFYVGSGPKYPQKQCR